LPPLVTETYDSKERLNLGARGVAEDTRERILDTAERLFAERGFDGTSIRDVTAQAGVNLAAVHYHFHSKEALLAAVLARMAGPTNAERLRLMREVESKPGGPDLADLLRAFLLPELRLSRGLGEQGRTRARLMGRIFTEANASVHRLAMEQFSEVGGCFVADLQRVLTHLEEDEVIFRMQCVVAVLSFFLADTVPAEWKVADVNQPEAVLERMVTFLVAALEAPPTPLPTQSSSK
jgi:AcrR family transcriptional regulator